MTVVPSRPPIQVPSAMPTAMTSACSSHMSDTSWRVVKPIVRIRAMPNWQKVETRYGVEGEFLNNPRKMQ